MKKTIPILLAILFALGIFYGKTLLTTFKANPSAQSGLASSEAITAETSTFQGFIPTTITALHGGHSETKQPPNLIDGDLSTGWRSKRRKAPKPGYDTDGTEKYEWIKIEFPTPTVIDSLVLWSFVGEQRVDDPKLFSIVANQDGGGEWGEPIFNQTDPIEFSGPGTSLTFKLNNTVAYKYYRINITANRGGFPRNVALTEIEFRGPSTETVVPCPAQGTPCDDGDDGTSNDVEDGNCACGGSSCPVAGTSCDDGNSFTNNDVQDGRCNCAGVALTSACMKLDTLTTRTTKNEGVNPQNLLDGNTGTSWWSNGKSWIEMKFVQATSVRSIVMTSSHSKSRGLDPRIFHVEGADSGGDDANWIRINQFRDDGSFPESDNSYKFDAPQQTKVFELDNPYEYMYYRIVITKHASRASTNVSLSELAFLGSAECEDVIALDRILLRSANKEVVMNSLQGCQPTSLNPKQENRTYYIRIVQATTAFYFTPNDKHENLISINDIESSGDKYKVWKFIYDSEFGSHYIYNTETEALLYYDHQGLNSPEFSKANTRFKWLVEQDEQGRFHFKSLYEGPLPTGASSIPEPNEAEDRLFTLPTGAQKFDIDFDPVSTNPADPYVPPHKLRHPWQLNGFDWTGGDNRLSGDVVDNAAIRNDSLDIAEVASSDVTAVTTFPVINPFYTDRADAITANENGDNADYFWEEGWEILSYNFGYVYPNCSNESVSTQHKNPNHNIKIPYLMMYNRYSSVIRVMGLMSNIANKNMVDVTLSFGSGKKTNLFGLQQGRALNSMPKEELTMSTKLPSNAAGVGEWIYVDFPPVVYDPCTPLNSSNLQVSFTSYFISQVSLVGRGMSIQLPLGEGHQQHPDFLIGTIDEDETAMFVLDQVTTLGKEKYTNTGELEVPAGFNSHLDNFGAVGTIITGSPDDLLDRNGILGKVLKTTVLGQAFTTVESLWSISGASNASSTQNINLPPPRPYVAYSDLKLEGFTTSKEASRIENDFWIATPGSYNAQNGPDFSDKTPPIEGIVKSAPFYNEPLGVFTLVNQPELNVHVELEDYDYSLLVKNRAAFFGVCTSIDEGRKRTQINKKRMKITASLGSYINYTFNENLPINWGATRLTLTLKVKDINVPGNEVLLRGDIDDQASFNELIQENFEVTTFNTITAPKYATRDEVYDKFRESACTGFVVGTCKTNEIIDLVEIKDYGIDPSLDYGNFFDGLLINDKGVIAKMRSGNIQETLESLNFELIVEGIIAYQGGNKTVDVIQKYPLIIKPFIEKRSYTSEATYPWGPYKSCIDIIPPVGVNQQNVDVGGVYGAGSLPYTEYDDVPEPRNAPISVDYYNPVTDKWTVIRTARVSAAQVQDEYCITAYQTVQYPEYNYVEDDDTDNVTNNESELRETSQSYSSEEIVLSTVQIKAYPNPTSGQINFDFNLPEAGVVKLVLYNSSGQEVKIVVNETMQKGMNHVNADVSDMEAGMYVYRLETEMAKPVTGRIVVQN